MAGVVTARVNRGKKVMTEESFTWFAGVDWGSEKHHACIIDTRGTVVGERQFPHSGVGLAELGDWLLSIAGTTATVAVAIEVPHGPVVDSLIDRGFVVYAINPKQLDRLRDRFSVAGAKDDRRDAYVLGDGIRTDRRLFRRLHVADPRIVELRAWSRLTEELQEERVRLGNRVQQQLWRYYPQMQKITNDLAAPWFLALWVMAPTPGKARQLRRSTVEQILKKHRIRRIDADTVLRMLREPAIKVAEGIAEAASIHLRSLIARLHVVNRELRQAEQKLDQLCAGIGETEGDDRSFTTYPLTPPAKTDCPNQAFRSGASAALPDCRAYEMVSPLEKNGDIKVLVELGNHPAGLDQSSEDGDRFAYSSSAAFGDAVSGPYSSEYLAARTADGWSTKSISPPRSPVSLTDDPMRLDVA